MLKELLNIFTVWDESGGGWDDSGGLWAEDSGINLYHTNRLDNVEVQQLHNLSIDDLSHAHSMEDIERLGITVSEVLHAHTLDGLEIDQFHTLVVNKLYHTNFLDSPAVGADWFTQRLNAHASEPIRRFTMAGSDHSNRVITWPKIRRDIETVKPVNVGITLSNADGLYNGFHESLYTITATCTLEIGFENPTGSDTLYVKIYSGAVEKVGFQESGRRAKIFIKDKVFDFSLRKIGSTDDPVDFSGDIPSDIAWTLCTCYGGLSNVQSTSNADIDYTKFSDWAETFSADSVTADAHYEGEKTTKALFDICEYTDSFVHVDGDGKIVFDRFVEVSSNDFLVEEGKYKKIDLDIDLTKIVNKQYVSYNYSVASDYWQNQVSNVETTSVNSFRLHESVLEKENFWYTSSQHASNLSSRKLGRLSVPPRYYKVDLPLFGLHRSPGDTIRIVNSFFNITSGSGFRISEQHIDMQNLAIKIKTNEALVANAFYLDVSDLDGNELLL